MTLSETFAASLTFVRIVALGLAVISIGLSASAFHDDAMFSAWLNDANESGFNKTMIKYWDRCDTLFETIFITVLCVITTIGGIHLVLCVYIEKVEYSMWGVPFLAICGIITLGVTELEIHSTVRYETRITENHPCLSQSFRLKPELYYHLCQETASKAFAAAFAILVGIMRQIQAVMDWYKIKQYRKTLLEEEEQEEAERRRSSAGNRTRKQGMSLSEERELLYQSLGVLPSSNRNSVYSRGSQ